MLWLLNFQFSQWALILLAGDLAVYSLSVMVGLYLQPMVGGVSWFFWEYDKLLLLLVGLNYVTILYIANLYDHYQDFRARENFSRLILSALIGTLTVTLFFYYLWGHFLARKFIEWQGLFFVWLLVLWRYSFSAIALPQRLQRQVLIVGAGSAGRKIMDAIRQRPNCGLAAIGFVDDDLSKADTVIEGVPVLGNAAQLPELVKDHKIGLVVVAITHEKSPALLNLLTKISFDGCQVTDMPGLYEFLSGSIPIDYITDIWLFLNSLNKSTIYYRHLKRLMDLALSALGLLITTPLMLLIAALIKSDSPGTVFFRQERLGQDSKPFQIIKFRTMVKDAERYGPQFAREDDPRITRAGKYLRRLRLDELPQLINILKGDMSFIGPRPEREVFIREFQKPEPIFRTGRRVGDPQGVQVICGYQECIPFYSYRLLVKPGVTGWAQVMYPYAASLGETKEKLQFDLYYIKNMGVVLDIAILLRTIRIVLFGRGR
jgi:exopolysaccharide biosynthesis polyprenyl glycosylphosphotransferase